MPIADKTAVSRASTNAATIPDFPKFPQSLIDVPGMQELQVLQQNWWDVVRRQIAGNDQENAVYAKKLASANGASVTEVASAVSTIDGYLEAFWAISVNANNAWTGIQLFASDQVGGEGTAVSEIILLADRTKIYTSSGNKQLFSADASAVYLGDVLTVDLINAALYIGAGNFANADTPFYVDDMARFSLEDRFVWDGADLDIIADTVTLGSGVTQTELTDAYLRFGTLGSGEYIQFTNLGSGAKLDIEGAAGHALFNAGQILLTEAGGSGQPQVYINAIGESAIYFGPSSRTNLYELSADKLKSDDMLIADLGIGVGNSAAATSMGSITDAIEVFDASGNSLGYVPVYDSFS